MADTKLSAETLLSAISANHKIYVSTDTGAAPDSNAARFSQVQDFIRTAFGTANDTGAGFIEAAVQSEMETGTDITRAVVPGRQHFHPSAAKVWIKISADQATVNKSYNISSYTDSATGDGIANFSTAFSDAHYAAVCETNGVVGAGNASGYGTLSNHNSASALRMISYHAGNGVNVTYVDIIKSMVAFGDQ